MSNFFLLVSIFVFSFSKTEFFTTISSDSKTSIEKMISKVEGSADSIDKEAYLGALLMKSADFKETPKEKLSIFKSGKLKLENVLQKAPSNTEFRFLRLIIQENAPKILKYNTNLEEDAAIVQKNLHNLPNEVQAAVRKYSKTSTVLKL